MEKQTQVQQVTMKDSKKVEVCRRLAEYNRRKREELAQLTKAQSEPKLTSSQYYDTGAIVVIGALGILGYCVYQFMKGESKETPAHKLEIEQAMKWTRKVSLMTCTKQQL